MPWPKWFWVFLPKQKERVVWGQCPGILIFTKDWEEKMGAWEHCWVGRSGKVDRTLTPEISLFRKIHHAWCRPFINTSHSHGS